LFSFTIYIGLKREKLAWDYDIIATMSKAGKKFDKFVEIVSALRKNCPWDREQTIQSLRPYLVEEVYEAIQAIDDKSYKKLGEELGDMLLHIVMLSVFAKEDSYFSINDVIQSITSKMIRRHPHVFAKGKAKTKEEVWMRWEKIKQAEALRQSSGRAKAKGRKHKGILESIPQSLPALYRADKVQRRAARVGFDWDRVAGAWEKVHEEMDEIHDILKSKIQTPKSKTTTKSQIQKLKEEIGDLLFAVVNVARKLDISAEEALQRASTKFMRRFSKIEKKISAAGKKMTLAEMDALWNKVKASES
jgi:tetrapyrrole methylase family protein/MazG family protein